MNYHYEIVVFSIREIPVMPMWNALFVREEIKETNKVTYAWKIEELRNLQYPPHCAIELQKSFFRTQKWLFENHPECLL